MGQIVGPPEFDDGTLRLPIVGQFERAIVVLARFFLFSGLGSLRRRQRLPGR